MKNKVLKLCKRLNKVTASEIAPILMLDEKEVSNILNELISEDKLTVREDLIYFYKEVERKAPLPLFFEYRTEQELELIKRCFCADLPCTQTGIILNLDENIIGKFNQYYREFIYKFQYNNLLKNFNLKPQEPRIRTFFDTPVYFYYYDGLVYVSEQKLFAKNYSYKLNSLEVRAFKKVYLKIRRRIYHNCMKYYLSHHVAEAILRTQLSGIDLLDYLKKYLNF